MAPKKKSGKRSGKKKLANMTEEERLLYLEQQRLAEEEKAKEKASFLERYLKSKLEVEEKNTRFNTNKLNHQWRNFMRDVRAKELKKDIEILSQTFERVVDRKEAVIQLLEKDLADAEEQYAMAFRSHVQNVDRLICIQYQRLNTLEDEFEIELSVLKEEFDTERQVVFERHKQEMEYLNDVLFALEQQFSDKEFELRNEFQSNRDELKNKSVEEKHALRHALQAAAEDLWKQFKAAMESYKQNTEERRKIFESLKEKDERAADEIEQQMRRIHRLNEKIANMKSKLSTHSRENEARNKEIKEGREKMSRHFQELKHQLAKIREQHKADLGTLVLESNVAIKDLKKKIDRGEKLLRLAEMCRRLETEEEKVLPFYQSSLTKEEQDDVTQALSEPFVEPLSNVMFEYTPLENFWKRYNKVHLDKLALDKEKSQLTAENAHLRILLKQYLDGISVNQEVLGEKNPLFVVNSKTNVRLNGPVVPVGESRVKAPSQLVLEGAIECRQKQLMKPI